MKIAVTYENGMVFQHFGHTEQFKIYEAENGQVVSSRIVPTAGQGHGALAAFLAGTLGYDADVHCDHHDHEHGTGAHDCGGPTCGGHSCHE